jgi:hypothetical protein
MAKSSIFRTIVALSLFFSLVFAQDREPPFRINIGYFKFPLNDPAIKSRIHQTERNLTFWEHLYDSTKRYWDSNRQRLRQPLSDQVEEDDLRRLANETQVTNEEVEVLLEGARERHVHELANFGNSSQRLWDYNRTDLSEQFLDEIEDEFKMVHHQRLAAYAGVGSSVDCSVHVDAMLQQMSEWEKAGMAAASTLMALLPTFLAFGNL